MSKLKIKIIIGSTRQGRFSDKPAQWIFDELKKNSEVEAEVLDLRDYQMPFFDEPKSPAMSGGAYSNETVKKWSAKIQDGDGFVMIAPEYNHGYSAVLKNAMDSIYSEWNKKAVAFVAYGGVGGARAVEQLRQVAVELQMTPVRSAIHIMWDVYTAAAAEKVPVNPEVWKPLTGRVGGFLDDLIWHSEALKVARLADKK